MRCTLCPQHLPGISAVMAGLVPAIHVFRVIGSEREDVDARHKAGHDGEFVIAMETSSPPPRTGGNDNQRALDDGGGERRLFARVEGGGGELLHHRREPRGVEVAQRGFDGALA